MWWNSIAIMLLRYNKTCITEHVEPCFDSEIQHPVNRGPCMLHCGLAGKAQRH